MDKSNFGSLISKLVDDLPTNPYINEDGEIEMEEGKVLKNRKVSLKSGQIFQLIYHVSVDHQHNLDHTYDELICIFYILSACSNGRSVDEIIKVLVVPGSNPV